MRAALVLCGGRSTRMGRDKATPPFGGETLLARTVHVDEAEPRAVDPDLLALTNCDAPESYAAALARWSRTGA